MIQPLSQGLLSSHPSGLKLITVEPRLSGPRLSGFLDYPDFFSGLNLVMNISVLVTIKILTDILFKTSALKGAVKCEGFLLSKSKSNARACRN